MGPVIGMTPDKRAETPGAEKVAGLSQIYKMGSLPEAGDAARPKATLVGSESADDELTNLNWLHESSNLLTNLRLGSEGLPMVSPLYDIEGDEMPSFGPSCYQNPEKKSATSKPPYSFSLLIYMAIEHSPNKCLPVKEIYSWILDRFPYFATAPTGWKNSVRHNLSLNKCFQKVERSHGKVNGKGSLWCVDPEYKPNLMQALKKQPFSSVRSHCLLKHHCRRRGVTAARSVPPVLCDCRRARLQPPASTQKPTITTVPTAWRPSAAHPGRACLLCPLWMRCMNSSQRAATAGATVAKASTATRRRMRRTRRILWETVATHRKLVDTVL
ncbi:forkhead box N2, isoform CRA_a [Mus musculus]|nr:forkhead box N2, isoform CRA_a [Mus musculus]